MPAPRAATLQGRWAEPLDGFNLPEVRLASALQLTEPVSGAVGSFETLERLSTFASRTHALNCCPCGADHSADLLAHKLSMTALPEWAPAGGPESANITFTGEVGATPGTASFMSLGDSVFSQIETAGDQDWFAITLQAGVTYEFTLSGTGASPLSDPYLEIMDASGGQLAANDDSGAGLNSLLRYTPTTSGTYYLNAHHFSSGTGAYVLSASEAPPLPTYTITEIANYLVNEGSSGGRRWQSTSITYNIEALTAPQQLLAERALAAWSAVTPLTFTRVTTGGNITFRNTDPSPDPDDPNAPVAFAQNTFSGSFITASTVVVTSNWQSGDTSFDSYTYQTYIHEVGHALGLGHGGPYNGAATYGQDNIYTNDNWAYTVMSYFDQLESGHGSYRFVLGLQQADIAAIQQLYGARSGGTYAENTTFGFNSSAPGTNIDWSQFVLVQAEGTYRRPPSMTIYDTSGVDTINLSGFSQPQILDLRPGTFSSLGDRPNAGQPNYANVVAIEANTIIENAVGGAGNDRITGNTANNTITLGGGADTFVYASGGGADTITDFSVSVDRLDLSAFSSSAALAAFNGRTSSAGGTLLTFSAGQTILLQGVSTGQLTQSNLILSGSPPPPPPPPPPPGPTNGNDVLTGTTGNDTINGLGGNDVIRGLAADDRLNGGDGVELSAIGGQIYRLYLGALGREPDPIGHQNWITFVQSGQPFINVISFFITSPEFQARYGQPDNGQFVTLLYNNVLGRAPDPAGYNSWLSILNGGTSRADVVRGFTDSAEFIDRVSIAFQSYSTNVFNVDVEGQVYRLYQAALGRAPDAAGFAHWVNLIHNDAIEYGGAVPNFIGSTEFQSRYGSLNNTQFVTLLYNNVLGRAPDPQGLQGWVNFLNSGVSRADVLTGFAESAEFVAISRPNFINFMRTADLGWQDTLDGDTGNDVLFGGRGADTFVLNLGEGGTKTIYGLQAYDYIRLEGFASLAQFTSGLVQQGADVVFSGGGLSVRFVAASLATVVSVAQFVSGAEVIHDKDGALIGSEDATDDIWLADDGNAGLQPASFDFSRLGGAPLEVSAALTETPAARQLTAAELPDAFDFSGFTGALPPAMQEPWTAATDSLIEPMDTGFASAIPDPLPDLFDFTVLDRPVTPDWA